MWSDGVQGTVAWRSRSTPIAIGWVRIVLRLGLWFGAMLFFFIAGYSLHFECAHLGAYRVPPGAGPLIPSQYESGGAERCG